jgi:hypothetical protein
VDKADHDRRTINDLLESIENIIRDDLSTSPNLKLAEDAFSNLDNFVIKGPKVYDGTNNEQRIYEQRRHEKISKHLRKLTGLIHI